MYIGFCLYGRTWLLSMLMNKQNLATVMNRWVFCFFELKNLIPLMVIITIYPSVTLAGYKEGILALRSGDHQLALAILLPLARAGSPQAQYNVGLLFQQGHGIKKNGFEAKSKNIWKKTFWHRDRNCHLARAISPIL